MAAEQNHCPETQCLLGGSSLTITFCQTGTQRLVGDIVFCPVVLEKF
jgi:hypothetical protein